MFIGFTLRDTSPVTINTDHITCVKPCNGCTCGNHGPPPSCHLSLGGFNEITVLGTLAEITEQLNRGRL